jgi:hypothetical protein
VYAVDPANWRHVIAADAGNGPRMRESTNGGDSWDEMQALTTLLTGGGQLRFRTDLHDTNDAPLVTAISFNPLWPSHVLIGTSEGGIYFSGDRGATWGRINGSEPVTYVTSFFWATLNTVYVSTYGRGLWRLENRPIVPPELFDDFCDGCDVVADHGGPDRPPFDGSVLVFDGEVRGVRADDDGRLREVFVTRGSSVVFTGEPKDLQEDVAITETHGKETYEPLPEHPDGWPATGVVFTSDDTITGTVYTQAKRSLPPPEK